MVIFHTGLASIFWALAANAGIYIWLEYVKSALNNADPPSRICELLGDKKRTTPMVNIGIPNSFFDLIETQKAFIEHRFGVKRFPAVYARGGLAMPPNNTV